MINVLLTFLDIVRVKFPAGYLLSLKNKETIGLNAVLNAVGPYYEVIE